MNNLQCVVLRVLGVVYVLEGAFAAQAKKSFKRRVKQSLR